MDFNLEGVIPPIVTPFDEDENVDYEATRREVRYLFDQDINGISASGSTGEGVLLNNEEIKKNIEIIDEENNDNLPILAGVIRNSTRDAIETGKIAKEAGADILLVTPTFYHGASARGNYEYYKEITENLDIPVIVYNVVPTNQISPEEMLKMSEIENLIGVKQIDAEKVAAMVSTCGEYIKVFSACDDVLYSTYVSGADGAIAAIITAVPELCVKQWKAFKKGNQAEAMEIHKRLYHVFEAYFDEKPFVGKIKAVINQLGRPVGKARKPVQEPDKDRQEFIKKQLEKAELL